MAWPRKSDVGRKTSFTKTLSRRAQAPVWGIARGAFALGCVISCTALANQPYLGKHINAYWMDSSRSGKIVFQAGVVR